MDKSIRALTGLSAVDDQLSEREALGDELSKTLQERRAAFRDALSGVILAAYDALGRAGRRPVVVEVRRAHCSGCNLRLPPHLDSAIRRRQSLCICPYCRRLLYASARAEGGEIVNESKHEPGGHPAAGGRPSKRTPRSLRARLVRQQPGKRPGGRGSAGTRPAHLDSVER